jgi:stage II sporulation protein D
LPDSWDIKDRQQKQKRQGDRSEPCSPPKERLTISAVNLRKAIGYTVIKSTNFEVTTNVDEAIFVGIGYGHGVGLCQWGAKQRAADGFNYREILSYYYPGTRLEKIYGE